MQDVMRKLSVLIFCFQSSAFAADIGVFSSKSPSKTSLKELADSTKSETSSLAQVEGVVEKICERKGCWMILKDGDQAVRVTFKGYSFFVGKEIEGKKVLVEGVLKKRTISVREQKHLLEDAGASVAEQEAVKEKKETWEFIASGVRPIQKT